MHFAGGHGRALVFPVVQARRRDPQGFADPAQDVFTFS
jgi:hypothetical protein